MPDLPPFAAWRLVDAHEGFEVVFFDAGPEGCRVHGQSTGAEEGRPWAFSYLLTVDAGWATRSARVVSRTASGERELVLEGDGERGWLVDGEPAPAIAGCLDVDLEGSAFTNALPVHRLELEAGNHADAPAAYVRAADLSVERLDQTYARLDDRDGHPRYDYASPRFAYEGVLTYDEHGLVLEYPGIAVRAL